MLLIKGLLRMTQTKLKERLKISSAQINQDIDSDDNSYYIIIYIYLLKKYN